jgi:hypothetical protein
MDGDFLDLRLTRAQAARLWGFGPDFCSAVLDARVATRFLSRTSDTMFDARRRTRVAPTRIDPRLSG